MKYFLLISIISFTLARDNSCLDFQLIRRKISLSSNSRLATVDVFVKNCSAKTIVLYGVDGNLVTPLVSDSEYCDDNVSGGLVLHVFNEMLEPVFPEGPVISEEIDYKPVPKEVLNERLNSSRALFLKNTRVLGSGESVTISKKIDLTDFPLHKGKYFLQVTYFIGKHLNNYVDSIQVKSDQIKYDASIFNGCVKSNRVPLLME